MKALTTLALMYLREPERRPGLVRDAAFGFGGAFVLYLPWLPTALDQLKRYRSDYPNLDRTIYCERSLRHQQWQRARRG